MSKDTLKALTLIEILIALTIFSIIAVSLYSTFSSGILAWKKSEDVNRLYREARWALDKMAAELRNAIIYDFTEQYPDLNVFQGQKDNIAFLVGTNSGIKKISYFLQMPQYADIHRTFVNYQGSLPSRIITHYEEGMASLTSLKRKEESFIGSLQLEENQQKKSKTLSSIVKQAGLSFSYAYAQTTGEEAQEEITWKDSWQDNSSIPQGVKISLTLENPKNPEEVLTFTKTVFIPIGTITEPKG